MSKLDDLLTLRGALLKAGQSTQPVDRLLEVAGFFPWDTIATAAVSDAAAARIERSSPGAVVAEELQAFGLTERQAEALVALRDERDLGISATAPGTASAAGGADPGSGGLTGVSGGPRVSLGAGADLRVSVTDQERAFLQGLGLV